MSDRYFISTEDLRGLTGDLLAAGTEVIAPVATDICQSPSAVAASACRLDRGPAIEIDYTPLTDAAELDLSRGLPQLSLKGYFLPEHEVLCSWKQKGTTIEMQEVATTFAPRVVIGAKPCDAAGLAVVDQVMNWDYQDELWNGRREATTIINLSCPVIDDSCFCTAVGAAPDDTKGADGLLTQVDGGYVLEVTSDKGRAFAEAHKARLNSKVAKAQDKEAAEQREAARATVKANLEIDADSVRDWINTHFEDPLLAMLAMKCNGCGACTGVCPTCHCFDIIDEVEGVGSGCRRRCWDTCQAPTFTLHASGHNPRQNQHVRYRQRINHKFSIYPLKFGEVLCTGCGRCTRVCHAGQDLVEILTEIDIAARRPRVAEAAS